MIMIKPGHSASLLAHARLKVTLVYIDPTMFTKAYCQQINLSPLPDIDGKNEF